MPKLALVMSGHLNYSLLVLSCLPQDCQWRNSIHSRQWVTAPPVLGRAVCFNHVPGAKFLLVSLWKWSEWSSRITSSSSSFPRLYNALLVKLFHTSGLHWGVPLIQGHPSFLGSHYRLSWNNGASRASCSRWLVLPSVPRDNLSRAGHVSSAGDNKAAMAGPLFYPCIVRPSKCPVF